MKISDKIQFYKLHKKDTLHIAVASDRKTLLATFGQVEEMLINGLLYSEHTESKLHRWAVIINNDEQKVIETGGFYESVARIWIYYLSKGIWNI